eukprot:6167822-Prymnesium_polylepis.1
MVIEFGSRCDCEDHSSNPCAGKGGPHGRLARAAWKRGRGDCRLGVSILSGCRFLGLREANGSRPVFLRSRNHGCLQGSQGSHLPQTLPRAIRSP